MQLLNTLYVLSPDSRLRLENDTLRVEVEDETRLRVPLHHLQSVVCFGHVAISAPLMHRLAEDSIALVLLDANGRFKARLEGPTQGNVLLRQAQHLIVQKPDALLRMARALVAGKLRNQRHVLLRGARDAKDAADIQRLTRAADDLAASLRALPAAADLDVVRGIEGEAARSYFDVFNCLIRADLRDEFGISGRTRRPPKDRSNALLSFFYSMWMNDCRSACEAVGLDPQVGCLHVLRPGRAALALDLMEEFRPMADRLALTLVNRGQLKPKDFVLREGGAVLLEPEARKGVVKAFQERKLETLTHPLLAESVPVGLLPLIQARMFARALRADTQTYIPFTLK
ncbi:MAG: type I-C CRISPR-associated endonuclease Cas1 [Rubrivivax sp.]|nr:type I-C CRISPR-associated endonuclease Cas1 [Rubrivivax sp.]